MAAKTGTSFRQALFFKDVCGFNLHDTMIYHKVNFIPLTHNRYEQAFEYIFVFSRGAPATFNPIMEQTLGNGSRYNLSRKGYCATIKEGAQRRRDEDVVTKPEKIRSNLFSYTLGSVRLDHPAPFPESLANDHIRSWSNPGDTVLDCFMGSNTTGKMAVKNGCKFIGIEIAEEYMQIAIKRLQQPCFQFAAIDQ